MTTSSTSAARPPRSTATAGSSPSCRPASWLPLAKVTPKLVDELYRYLGTVGRRRPATVLRFHAVLRAAFAQAERWSWVDRSPIDRATAPRVQRDSVRPPGVDSVLAVIAAAEQSRSLENALVLRLLAATGCRRGEVVGIQ